MLLNMTFEYIADGRVRLSGKCPMCQTTNSLEVDEEPFRRWNAGEYVQNAFPMLSADDREFLVSGCCPNGGCFDRAFSPEDEDEDIDIFVAERAEPVAKSRKKESRRLPDWLSGQVFYKMKRRLSKNSESVDDDWLQPRGAEEVSMNEANLISSRIKDKVSLWTGQPKHKVFLDLDIRHHYVPSSTPGHGHLYIDVDLDENELRKFIEYLHQLGIVGVGTFYQIDDAPEYGPPNRPPQLTLRMPGVTKKDI